MVMDESRSLPERATELNWKLLLILPVTASESSLLEIDLSQGGLCGKKKAAISSWWEGMIRFVLSLFSFAGVSKSDQFSPLSTRAPCWAVKANLQTCHLLFFFFLPNPDPLKATRFLFPLARPLRCFDTDGEKQRRRLPKRCRQPCVYKPVLFTQDEGLGSQDVFSSGLSSFLPLYGMVSSGKTELLSRHSSLEVVVCFGSLQRQKSICVSSIFRPNSCQMRARTGLTSTLQLNLSISCLINKHPMLNRIKCRYGDGLSRRLFI